MIVNHAGSLRTSGSSTSCAGASVAPRTRLLLSGDASEAALIAQRASGSRCCSALRAAPGFRWRRTISRSRRWRDPGRSPVGLLAAVGFDTYATHPGEAVAELRGQPIRSEFDPEIRSRRAAFLPDDYIPDTGQRLDFYRRLAQARDDQRRARDPGRAGGSLWPAARRGSPARRSHERQNPGAPNRRARLRTDCGPVGAVRGPDARLDPAKVMRLVQRKGNRWNSRPT